MLTIRRVRLSMLFICLICGLNNSILLGQTLSGQVSDKKDGQAIAFCTIFLLHPADSSIVSYTTTNEFGVYKLECRCIGDYLLRVKSLSYKNYLDTIIITSAHPLIRDIQLEEVSDSLPEVVVKGKHIGVIYRSDTIRYTTKSFTDGSERVLKDVLNKLPGIEVDAEGNIKAQGKDVSKVLLNGQDYFGNNPQVATKNLSADLAETIEVLHNHSEYSMLSGFQSREQTVLNVGVNKSKLNKLSGDIMAGVGYRDKFNGTTNLLMLRSKAMIALVGAVNNTGDQVFSTEDYFRLLGGVNEVLGKSGGLELSAEERRLLFPRSNVYSKTNGLAALNLAYQPTPILKLNSYLLYNELKALSEDLNRYRFYTSQTATSLSASEHQQQEIQSKLISAYLKLEYAPSKHTSLSYMGTFSRSDMEEDTRYDSNLDKQQTLSHMDEDVLATRTVHKIVFMKAIGKNVFMANAKLAHSYAPNSLTLSSDRPLLPIHLLQLAQGGYTTILETGNKKTITDLSVTFLQRLNNAYHLQSQIGLNVQHHTINHEAPNSQFNDRGSEYDAFATLSLVKNKGVLRLKFGTAFHQLSLERSGTTSNYYTEHFMRLTPLVELSLIFNPKHSLSTMFSQTTMANDMTYFRNYQRVMSYKSYGDISNATHPYNDRYQFMLNYHYFDGYSDITTILTAVHARTHNSITTDYHQSDITSSMRHVDAPQALSNWINLQLTKGLGFMLWRASLSTLYSGNHFSNYLDGVENRIKSDRLSSKLELKSLYQVPLNGKISVSVEFLGNKSTFQPYSRFITHSYGGELIYGKDKLKMEAGLQYVVNSLPTARQDMWYVNAQIKYDITKALAIQFRGQNLLHINDMAWSNVSYLQNYEVEQHMRQIPGNLLLSLSWRL